MASIFHSLQGLLDELDALTRRVEADLASSLIDQLDKSEDTTRRVGAEG